MNEFEPAVQDRHVRPDATFWRKVREGFANWFYTSPFANVFCCTDPGDHWDMQLSRRREEATRVAMAMSSNYRGRESAIQVAMDSAAADGYPMEIDKSVDQPLVEVRALVVPKFTASVVVALRARLGQRPQGTVGNRELVEREALRLMREYNVREMDRATHLPLIIRTYFREDLHYRVPTHRSRMSRFHRWLTGGDAEPSFDPLA
jgi:hypothetical protein